MKRFNSNILILFIIGIFFLCSCNQSEDTSILMTFPVEETSISENAVTEETTYFLEQGMFVHICGEVQIPGVYEMPKGSRIVDVVNAAGGFKKEANVDLVNLAKEVEDGMQVMIPSINVMVEQNGASKEAGKIDINNASLEELCSIPGVGESRATDIIRYREENGAFKKIEDIMKVSGIKQGVFEKMKEKICVQ